MSRGVLYIASGSRYLEEAKTSAESLKRHNPSLPVTLYTDHDIDKPIFDQIISIEKSINGPGDSILSKEHFPYEHNLYLDTDTYVCGDVRDVFEVLDISDMAIAHNEARARWDERIYEKSEYDLPDAFTEYNSGVVAYNNCAGVKEVFNRWAEVYRNMDCNINQPAFRVALYDSDVDISTLPPEYNFMNHTVGYACGEIKIIHKTSSSLERSKVAELLNDCMEPRVVTWDDYPFRVVPDSHRSRRHKIKYLMKSAREKQKLDGSISLLRAILDKLFSY